MFHFSENPYQSKVTIMLKPAHDDDADDDDEMFCGTLDDQRRSAFFPAGNIVRDPHHLISPTRREQDWNLRRTWVQNLLNHNTTALSCKANQWNGFFVNLRLDCDDLMWVKICFTDILIDIFILKLDILFKVFKTMLHPLHRYCNSYSCV